MRVCGYACGRGGGGAYVGKGGQERRGHTSHHTSLGRLRPLGHVKEAFVLPNSTGSRCMWGQHGAEEEHKGY